MNISDEIERFILDALGSEHSVLISRNSLAGYFSCAPSQINYVLATRFTPDRGFITASRRGGGGYIEIMRVDISGDVGALVREGVGEEITYGRARGMLDALEAQGVLCGREKNILLAAVADGALTCAVPVKDKLRARILKNVLLEIIKEND